MRHVERPPLNADVQRGLDRLQAKADKGQAAGTLDVSKRWESARKGQTLHSILEMLRSMMGHRERCMYCLDSHGTDIDHFWPKTRYAQRMFSWPNLLLSCTECGRLKSDLFPLSGDEKPLLVDPTAENPWLYLDFDPGTGNIVARFEPEADRWSVKGAETVKVLHLDRREALATGYRKTYQRLAKHVEQSLASETLDAGDLMSALRDEDEHGLLWWCFCGSGQNQSPFSELRKRHPSVWKACAASAANSTLPS